MKAMKKCAIILLVVTLYNCSVSPQPINYGKDGCYFCKMTIVDKLHAAEIVTKKRKIYKFDASECMINYIKDIDTTEIKYYLTNVYTNPEKLMDATQATFLISKNIPSPMGAYLSAFNLKEEALKIQLEKGGIIYSWKELQLHLNK